MVAGVEDGEHLVRRLAKRQFGEDEPDRAVVE